MEQPSREMRESISPKGELHIAHLPAPRRRLAETMRRIGHGRIENLTLRGREPQASPPPDVFREVVIGKPREPHPARRRADFSLKHHLAVLFADFDSAPEGVRYLIRIQDGLPISFSAKEPYER